MRLFGIEWVGINPENGRKLVLSLIFIAVLFALASLLLACITFATSCSNKTSIRVKFWSAGTEPAAR